MTTPQAKRLRQVSMLILSTLLFSFSMYAQSAPPSASPTYSRILPIAPTTGKATQDALRKATQGALLRGKAEMTKTQGNSPNSEGGKSKSPNSEGGKKIHDGESDISGSLDIKIGVKSVKNIIDGGDGNEAKTRIGVVSKSGISGKLTINLEELGDINNRVNGTNNKSYINIGTVENSKIGGESIIKVKAKNITSEVLGGKDNIADMRIGTVENSHIKTKLDINVDVEGEIKNSLKHGSNNQAIMKIGSIENSSLGEALIKVKAKNITNEVSGGTFNKAEMHIGTVGKNSDIKNKADIDVNVSGNIKNFVESTGSKNEAIMKVGSIENSKLGEAKIVVVAKNITNSITSNGNNNKAIMNVGTITNTNGVGKVDINVNINGDIRNSISGDGSDNEARMQIGGVNNAKVGRQVDITVKSQGDITNEITTGSKNKSEVTMGFVE